VLGADEALKRGAHIEIDIVVRRFSAGVRRWLAGASWLAIAVFLAFLVVYGVQLTRLNVERPLGDTGLSYVWVTLAIPVGALLMLSTTLRLLWRAWVGREAFSLEGRDGMVL
jgi:TRAP-type C4-dicarboxylate transport system permease small subunit